MTPRPHHSVVALSGVYHVEPFQGLMLILFIPSMRICNYSLKNIKNYLAITNIEDACKILKINKFYLTHIFKEQLGMPPIKYLLTKRMEKAKHLLSSTNSPISEIALKCGYTDTAYFCRVFKKAESITPLQYRNQVKNNNLPLN